MSTEVAKIRKRIYDYRQQINYLSAIVIHPDTKEWERSLHKKEIKRLKHEIVCNQKVLEWEVLNDVS